jgi:ABC-type branched-subunit amino acid transport system substrate-binding protein
MRSSSVIPSAFRQYQGLLRAIAPVWFAGLLAIAGPAGAAEQQNGPGVTATAIKIGQTVPFSGPASSFAIVARIEAAYLQMINSKGGVNGRKIELIQLDDAYSPPRAVEQTRKLVGSDEVLAIAGTVGTPSNLAVAKYLNGAKVPQILAMSGSAALDNAQLYPWTTLFYAPQVVEGRIAARYILDTKPDAKLAILFQNDEFGKGYLNAFKAELGSKAQSMIVKEESYDLTSPTIDSQIVSLKASGADAFFQATTPKFTAQAIRKAHEIGWKPLHVILATSSQPSTTLKSAGFEASTGIVTSIWRKLPGNPERTNDPAMKDYFGFMKQWAPKEDPEDPTALLGYIWAQMLVEVIGRCNDDLSRENLMKQATTITDLQMPMFLPGITINVSSAIRTPWRAAQIVSFNGRDWIRSGGIITVPLEN